MISTKGRLCVWVSTNRTNGLGHFYRSLGYIGLFKDAFFFSNDENSTDLSEKIFHLRSDNPLEIYSYLKMQNTKVLLIDHYFLSDEILIFFEKIKDIKTIYFDGFFRNLNFDAIINTNIYANTNSYRELFNEKRYFLGCDYLIFRDEIEKYKDSMKLANSIFICIGGSDPKSITQKLIPLLSNSNIYTIVLGPGCSRDYFQEIKSRVSKSKLLAQVYHNPSNFFELLSQAESAIVSASTLTYESLYLKVNIVAVELFHNQKMIAQSLREHGIHVLHENSLCKLVDLIQGDKFSWIEISIGAKSGEFVDYIRDILNS